MTVGDVVVVDGTVVSCFWPDGVERVERNLQHVIELDHDHGTRVIGEGQRPVGTKVRLSLEYLPPARAPRRRPAPKEAGRG